MPTKEKRAKACHAPQNFRFVTHTFSGHDYYTVHEHQRATTHRTPTPASPGCTTILIVGLALSMPIASP
jgi:hypothetical protein